MAHLHFFQSHKAQQKNTKEPPSQRTTTQQQNEMDRQKKGQQVTGVLQKHGFSAKLNICATNKHKK